MGACQQKSKSGIREGLFLVHGLRCFVVESGEFGVRRVGATSLTDAVNAAPAGHGEQPGLWVCRRSIDWPALEGREKRVAQSILCAGKVAGAPGQERY
jgi:hypothetical protein